MKAFLAVLFISLVSLYISVVPNKGCNEVTSPTSLNDCYNTTVRTGYYTCCYENYLVLSKSNPSCVELTQENFTNIKEFMKQRQSKMHSFTNYTLQCKVSSSNYLALSLLSLIFLLL